MLLAYIGGHPRPGLAGFWRSHMVTPLTSTPFARNGALTLPPFRGHINFTEPGDIPSTMSGVTSTGGLGPKTCPVVKYTESAITPFLA
ncbi:MAG: hypothetical protein CM15mP103_00910 [Gammaproteobacteria bacterium]|nr:MAG: hypothetical protein CM15mP103_00910 [Gammaproteobacteria bacterium]